MLDANVASAFANTDPARVSLGKLAGRQIRDNALK